MPQTSTGAIKRGVEHSTRREYSIIVVLGTHAKVTPQDIEVKIISIRNAGNCPGAAGDPYRDSAGPVLY